MALPALSPPPRTGNRAQDAWNELLYRKLGEASIDAPIYSLNITELLNLVSQVTGQLLSTNMVVGTALNITNDATCDSTDIDATNTTVRIYGPGGVGTAWNIYRNGVIILANIPATSFTGEAYATDYYISYATDSASWAIGTSYLLTTGDKMVRFHVRTHDSNGVTGSGVTGGGGSAAGSTGGYGGAGSGAGSGGGHGALQ